jgi:hypothetical protein
MSAMISKKVLVDLISEWLEQEVEDCEWQTHVECIHSDIIKGRVECANDLKNQIEKWERDYD